MKITSIPVFAMIAVLAMSMTAASVPAPALHPTLSEDGYLGLSPGLTWICCPVNTTANSSNMGSQENVTWMAAWNTSAASWEYWFPTDNEGNGYGTNFLITYTSGFVVCLNASTDVNASGGEFPYPAHLELELGLSLHGNPAPLDLNASYICANTLNGDAISWAAIWNITGEKFDYWFPTDDLGNGYGTNFEAWAFGAIWFYQTSNETVMIEFGMPPDQHPN